MKKHLQKHNIKNLFMFLGCLVLSFIITQPILTRAQENGEEYVTINTSFNEKTTMVVDDLYVNGKKIATNGSCEESENCLDLAAYAKSSDIFSAIEQVKSDMRYSLKNGEDGYVTKSDFNTFTDKIGDISDYLNGDATTILGAFDDAIKGMSESIITFSQYTAKIKPGDNNPECNSGSSVNMLYIFDNNDGNDKQIKYCMKLGEGNYQRVPLLTITTDGTVSVGGNE